jgi:superfamily II DNA or RNA helicase
MSKKDEIQEKIINTIVENNCRGIVLSSVRSGKTRMLIKSINDYSETAFPDILILYPNIDIQLSWKKELEILYDELTIVPNITYCTFASIEKMRDNKFDFVLVDEAHLLGEENQLPIAAEIAKNNKHCIFASGTYSDDTLQNIKFCTEMDLIVNYSTEQAIKDGIVNNFNVYVHTYHLDNTIKLWWGKVKKWQSTEAKECARLSNRVLNSRGEAKKFAALNRMRFINSCSSLVEFVNHWISQNKDERFLLFTGDENVGKRFNLPMYNSKSKDDEILKQFQEGIINQLCLIKKGSAGITYPNLNNILITAINSNGEALEQQIGRSLLMDTDEANIHIFVSSESFQQKWLNSALQSINKERIKFV